MASRQWTGLSRFSIESTLPCRWLLKQVIGGRLERGGIYALKLTVLKVLARGSFIFILDEMNALLFRAFQWTVQGASLPKYKRRACYKTWVWVPVKWWLAILGRQTLKTIYQAFSRLVKIGFSSWLEQCSLSVMDRFGGFDCAHCWCVSWIKISWDCVFCIRGRVWFCPYIWLDTAFAHSLYGF